MALPLSVETIVTTFAIDLAIFITACVLFLLYKQLRSFRADLENLDPSVSLKLAYLPEADSGLLFLFKQVYRMNSEDLGEAIGPLSSFLLSTVHYLLATVASCSLLSVALIVYYASYSSDLATKETYFGIENVLDHDGFVYSTYIFIASISSIIYGFCYFLYDRGLQEVPKQDTAVLLKQLPWVPRQEVAAVVSEYFAEAQVKPQTVYVVPDWAHAYELHLKLQELEEKLRFYTNDFTRTGLRPTKCVRCCKRVDAIEHFVGKVNEANEAYLAEKEERAENSIGLAFVTFATAAEAQQFLGIARGFKEWEASPAPHPHDILWENLPITRLSLVKKFLYSVLFFIAFFIVLTPTTFIVFWEELLQEVWSSFNSTYISSLLLLVYQDLLLPNTIKFLVKKEHHPTRVLKKTSALVKYLNYSFFYIFLYPILGLQVLQFLAFFLEDASEWSTVIATGMTNSGEFFTVFMIHQAFIRNGLDLLNLPRYFKVKAKMWFASTADERRLAVEADSFEYQRECSLVLTNFLLVLAFSVVYPVIIVPGMVFYCLRVRSTQYWVLKYNLLCYFSRTRSSTIRPVLQTFERRLVFYVFLFQVMSSAVPMLTGEHKFYSLFLVIATLSLLIYVALAVLFSVVKYEKQRDEDCDPLCELENYEHPLNQ